MIRDGYYRRSTCGREFKVYSIADNDRDAKLVGPDGEVTLRYGNFAARLVDNGFAVYYEFLRPFEPAHEAPASEPVYVYVAYMVSMNTQTKQAISHPDEERFLSMVDSWERQGYVVKAKKRIKFSL